MSRSALCSYAIALCHTHPINAVPGPVHKPTAYSVCTELPVIERAIVSVVPCERITEEWLDRIYPGAVENMGRNFGILAAVMLILWLLSFSIFRLRKIKNLR